MGSHLSFPIKQQDRHLPLRIFHFFFFPNSYLGICTIFYWLILCNPQSPMVEFDRFHESPTHHHRIWNTSLPFDAPRRSCIHRHVLRSRTRRQPGRFWCHRCLCLQLQLIFFPRQDRRRGLASNPLRGRPHRCSLPQDDQNERSRETQTILRGG